MNYIQQFKSYLETSQKASVATVKNYLSDIRKFQHWLETKSGEAFNPTLVTAERIEEFKAEMRELSVNSSDRYISSLRKFYAYLMTENIVSSNPFESENSKRNTHISDPYHLKGFKNSLYEAKASEPTIRNYLADINQFLMWGEEVAINKQSHIESDKNLLSKLSTKLIEEYKQRLHHTAHLSPVSINRKLSSIRKYLAFLLNQGLVEAVPFVINAKQHEFSQVEETAAICDNPTDASSSIESNINGNSIDPLQKEKLDQEDLNANRSPLNASKTYSSFGPLRLFQRIGSLSNFIFDLLMILPLVKIIEQAQYLFVKLSGKGIFTAAEANMQSASLASRTAVKAINTVEGLISQRASRSQVKGIHHFITRDNKTLADFGFRVSNLPKEMYAPISLTNLPFHKKMWHHIRFTRPNWYRKYHSYAITHYFHFAILMIVVTTLGVGIYNGVFNKARETKTLAAPPTAPPRILSFQGRLTDASDNPITATTNLRFTIYNDLSASGSAKLWEEVKTTTPDTDGIFNTYLGQGTVIPSTVFTDNASLYLGITVGTNDTELTPRQQIATVAFAANSETLQGLLPSTGAGAGTTNVVLALDSSGNLTIGGSATPTFQASGGQFTLSGTVLKLTTTTGSNSNIQITPDGLGKIDIQKAMYNGTLFSQLPTAAGAVTVDDLFAVNATSSGQSAFTLNQNGIGPLISASVSGVAKFTVDNAGAGTFASTLAVNGTSLTTSQSSFDLLNTNAATVNFAGAATTLTIGATTGTLALRNPAITLGGGGATTIQTASNQTLTIGGSTTGDIIVGPQNGAAGGTLRPSANNAVDLGTASFAYRNLYVNNIIGASTGVNGYWQRNANAISPSNITDDVLIGATATASALIKLGGTPNASTFFNTGSSGTVGIGTTATTEKLNIGGGNILLDNTQAVRFKDSGGVVQTLFTYTSGNNAQFTNGASTGSIQFTNANNAGSIQFILGTGGSTERARFTANGNLGIGTSTVPSPLTVNTTTTGNALATLVQNTLNADVLTASAGATSLFTLRYNGNVGIGTSLPASMLDIRGTTTGNALATLVQNTNADIFTASAGATTRFVIQNAGNVGIGTSRPAQLLDVQGGAGIVAQFSGRVVGANAAAANEFVTLAQLNGTNYWQLNSGALAPFSNTLDVLIGSTATGSAKFGFLNVANGTPIASVSANSGNNATYLTGDGTIATTNRGTLTLGNSGTYNTTGQILINPNGIGNVGIGTTNPLNKLTLVGGTTGNALLGINQTTINADVFTASASGTSLFTIRNNGNIGIGTSIAASMLDVRGTTTGNALATLVQNTSADIFTASAGATTRFVILNNGNVGIGSSIPTQALDVNGAIAISGTNTITSGRLFQGANGSASGPSVSFSADTNTGMFGTGSDVLGFATGGVERGRFDATGAFGLGTTTPATALHVYAQTGGNAAAIIDQRGTNTPDIFAASSSGTTRFVIRGGGNVGIGTSLPAQLFDVQGGAGIVAQFSGRVVGANAAATNEFVTLAQLNATNYWQLNSGALSPFSSTLDLLLGATATTSAKFAFINNIGSGTPAASISGNLALAAPSGANPANSLTAFNGGTLNFKTSPGGDAGATSRLIIKNDGNVGIGTTLVTDIDRKAVVAGDFFAGSATGILLSGTVISNAWLNSAAQTDVDLTLKNSTLNGNLFFQTASTTRMTIDPNGQVGIGSVTPQDKLDVNGGIAISGTTTITSGRLFQGANGSASAPSISFSADPNTGIFGTGSDVLGFATGGTERARFSINGSYGLGTTTPATALHVYAQTGGNAAAIIDQRGTNTPDIFAASSSGTTRFVIRGAGNVGIGTSLPAQLFDVQGGAGIVAQFSGRVVGANAAATNEFVTLSQLNSTNYWQLNSGVLSPFSDSLDVLVGGPATASAKIRLGATTNANSFFNTGGSLSIGTTTPLATLDVRGNLATTPTASFSGASTFAGLLVDNNGTGDLFTASKSGATKFSILNNGNIKAANYTINGGILYTDATGVFNQSAAGSPGQCLASAGGGAPTWSSCGGTNYWNQVSGIGVSTGGITYVGNTTTDLLIGGTATTSAKFAFINVLTGNPTLRVYSSNSSQYIQMYHDGTNGNITASTGTIQIGSGGGTLYVETDIINDTTSNNGYVQVSDKFKVNGTESAGNALVVLNNAGAGDLFTASASGIPKFTIRTDGTASSAGNLTFTTAASIQTTSAQSLTIGGNTTGSIILNPSNAVAGGAILPAVTNVTDLGTSALQFRNIYGQNIYNNGALLTNYWQRNSNALAPLNITDDILLGAIATSSAKIRLGGTTNADSYFNTGGNVGIGSTTPGAKLDVAFGTVSTTGFKSISNVGTIATTGVSNTGYGIYNSITNTPTTNANTAYGLYNLITDNASTANTAYGIWSQVDSTQNAVKNQYGGYFTNSNTSTIGGNVYGVSGVGHAAGNIASGTFTIKGGDFAGLGVGTSTGGVRNVYGLDVRSSTSNGNGSTDTVYGIKVTGGGTVTSGTITSYGLYVGNGTMSTTGTTKNIGINVAPINGADENYAAIFEGGNIGIGTTAPLTTLDVRGQTATTPIASFSGTTNWAGLLVDNNNANGDLFTASRSGATKFTINGFGDQTAGQTVLDGTTTANGAGTNSTTLILTSAASFDIGNYVMVSSTNCVTGVNICYAKITNKVSNTLTISPAISWATSSVVSELHIPEIGGTDLAQATATRYGRGYFIDGIVTGNGSTYYSDKRITLTDGDLGIVGGNVGIGTATPSARLAIRQDTAGDLLSIRDGNSGNAFQIASGSAIVTKATGFTKVLSCVGASCSSSDTGTFTDSTAEASTSAGVLPSALLTAAVTTGSFYVGLDKPFSSVYFNISTPGTNVSLVRQYWNGSAWTAMPANTDNTESLKFSGAVSFPFVPANWSTTTVNSTSGLYWIKFTTTSAPGVAPNVFSVSPSTGSRFTLYAQNGDTTPALTASDSGYIGINTTNPTDRLAVNGNIQASIFRDLENPAYFIDPAAVGNSLILNGNVGIGTTSTRTALDVVGTASLSANLTLRGASTAHTFNILDNGSLNFQRSPGGDAGVATSAFYIKENGNIGIGTTSPVGPLYVTGVTSPSNMGIRLAGNGGNRITFMASDNSTNLWNIDNSTGSLRFFREDYSATGAGANGSVKVTIQNDGNVGIGTTTIGSKLTVVGTLNQSGGAFNLGGGDFGLIDGGVADSTAVRVLGSGGNLYLQNGSGDHTYFRNKTAGVIMDVQNGGNIGIGTTTTQQLLTVGTTTSNGIALGTGDAGSGAWWRNDGSNSVISTNIGSMYYGYNGSSKNLYFYPGGTTAKMTLDTNGNIGLRDSTAANRQFSMMGSLSGGSIASFINTNTTDDANQGVLLIGHGTTSSTATRWIKFFSACTVDSYSGCTGRGSIRPNGSSALQLDTAAADYGEWMLMGEHVSLGDIISFDNNAGKKASRNEHKLVGVISNNSGVVGNSTNDGYAPGDNYEIVGQIGQVRTHVATTNGAIKRGDRITAGLIPGTGEKATTAGQIVGVALEDFNPENSSQITPCPSGTDSAISCGKLMLYVNPSWYDPDVYITDTGNLNIQTDAGGNFVAFNAGDAISRVGAFASAVIANLKVGAIDAQKITTQSFALGTENMTVAGQSLKNYILSVVTQANLGGGPGNNLPELTVGNLKTNLISPLASESAVVVSGRVFIAGNPLSNQASLEVTGDASISGTLRVKKIIADDIEGLSAKFATLSATTIINNYNVASDSGQVGMTNNSASGSGQIDPAYQNGIPSLLSGGIQTNYANIASLSGQFAQTNNLQAEFGQFNQGLMSLGPTSLSDTSVMGQLSVGGSMILAENTINVLGADLQIQPLRQGGVSFEGGLIAINTDGDLTVGGSAFFKKDVRVEGTLMASIIRPIPDQDITIQLASSSAHESQFAIKNASGSSVLTVNQKGDVTASGSGFFREVASNLFNIVRGAQADTSVTETTASASAGTAVIKRYYTERTIFSPYVSEKSLIYVTATSDTQGQTPYIARQTAEDPGTGTKGSFTIQIPTTVSQDIKINWWIVN